MPKTHIGYIITVSAEILPFQLKRNFDFFGLAPLEGVEDCL